MEEGDENGNVRGTYGYTDVDGVYRIVEYTADENGFRANIKTNEPGVGKDNPADVIMEVEEPPAAVVARWAQSGGQKGYAGGRVLGFLYIYMTYTCFTYT